MLFFLVVIMMNVGLNFMVLGATEPHRLQDHELYENKDKYKIIGIGPSDCMSHFDSPLASELLGKECFNYGQAGTSYTLGGVEASFENALNCQSPELILFFVSHENLYDGGDKNESAKTFIHSTGGMTNKIAKAKYYLKSSEQDGAIERLFQWKYILGDEEMPSFSEIKSNVKNKLSTEYKKYDIEWRNSLQDSTIYVKDGFVARATSDYYDDNVEPNYTVDLSGNTKKSIINLEDASGYDLDDMLATCKKKGIEAIVLMGPLSPELICEEGAMYDVKSKIVESVAQQNGVPYFDLNYIKKEYYRPRYDEWADDKHLDIDGAARYTRALCMVLNDYFEGKDTNEYFYSNLKDMIVSYDNITITSE